MNEKYICGVGTNGRRCTTKLNGLEVQEGDFGLIVIGWYGQELTRVDVNEGVRYGNTIKLGVKKKAFGTDRIGHAKTKIL